MLIIIVLIIIVLIIIELITNEIIWYFLILKNLNLFLELIMIKLIKLLILLNYFFDFEKTYTKKILKGLKQAFYRLKKVPMF